jgi:leucyl aminopeptidase
MDDIKIVSPSDKVKPDLLIVPICDKEPLSDWMQQIDRELHGGISFHLKTQESEKGKNFSRLITTNGAHAIPKILIVFLGKRTELTELSLQETGGQIAAKLEHEGLSTIAIDATDFDKEAAGPHIAFGMRLRNWNFDKYRHEHRKNPQLILLSNSPKQQLDMMRGLQCLYKGIELARDLTSEPANVLFPQAFAERCFILRKAGLKVFVLDEKQLEDIGANAILDVGRGSVHPPRLLTIEWRGGHVDQPPISLIGKGVCYDSGGINIKNTHLVEMKWDKAAAGTVAGVLYALALLRAPINVVGVIGLVENMTDGASFKPGDVIKTMSGKTVEVIDTDNEGRLVMADCLWYAQEKYGAECLVDMGTLTLETFGALAGEYAGLFCETTQLSQELIAAGNASGERLWPLPMGPAFARQIQSEIADLKNMGKLGYGESSAAAEFLKCFIQPNKRWAHIDISGVAWTQEDTPLYKSGAVTGYGVRLLTQWLKGKYEG